MPPTALAIWSALRQATCAVEIVLVGLGLREADWRRVADIVAQAPGARLSTIAFDKTLLGSSRPAASHISQATFARLLLHRLVQGRILYVDGDVLFTADPCQIAFVETGDAPVAAVPDFVAQKWCARSGGFRSAQARHRLARWRDFAGNACHYINAGVLLMDLDKIRADVALTAALEDVAAASMYEHADQDHLNRVFAGRFHLLSPEWNCSWGRLQTQIRFMRSTGLPTSSATTPSIVHYHGAAKPWLRRAWRRPLWHWPEVLRYRREQRLFNEQFPEFVF